MLVCWNTFSSVTTWDGTEFGVIIENNDQVFKPFHQYRLIGVIALPWTVDTYQIDSCFTQQNK